ncbi:MAG TPA: signal peptidase II [Solirubrobacteraceae bacterium]|nr:signal peptidase II [Solirubrobacteraceae bacterium]
MAVKRPYAKAAGVAAAVLVADQVSKAAVRGSLAPGASSRVVAGVLWIVHEQNSGVAFSLLTGSEAGVIVITLAVVAAVLVFFSRARERSWIWLACGLVIGGAIGNLIDRVRAGSVTDFVKLPDWPAFNVADTAITLGVVTLFIAVSIRGSAARTA